MWFLMWPCLKHYCLPIIPSSLRCPYGPQLCFLPKILVIDVTVVPDAAPDVAPA